MCRKSSLRKQLVLNIVPLFLIGEFIVIGTVFGLFAWFYPSFKNETSTKSIINNGIVNIMITLTNENLKMYG
jgi:hypothetical protein